MARREQGMAEALVELESAADRLGDWLQANIRAVAGAIVGLLVAAGLVAWIASARRGAEEEASAALAQARGDFLTAMGASPGAFEAPELANPEAAAAIRTEYEKRYGEIAEAHGGTVAGSLAVLEQASLASANGREEQAIEHLERGIAGAPKESAVQGVLLQRLAQRFEAAGRWADAAQRHEQASGIASYPLRHWALADAARCRALAGDTAAALGLYDRLAREAPELELSEAQRAQMLELRAMAEHAAQASPTAL